YQSALPNTTATFILIRDALVTKQFGVVVGLALLGLLTQNWRVNRTSLLLLIWIGLFCGLFYFLNEGRPILRIRIFAVVLPPLLLLVANGLGNLDGVPQRLLIMVVLLTNLATIDTRQNN